MPATILFTFSSDVLRPQVVTYGVLMYLQDLQATWQDEQNLRSLDAASEMQQVHGML